MSMARWGKRAAITAAALFLVCALAGMVGCSGGDKEGASGNGTLRVGVRSDVVGFGFQNENTGRYYGLEIDIAQEMAKRMGYADVEFVTVTPDSRKDMLLNGDIDCVAACYSIAESRLKNFDFSPSYYQDKSVIMVANSSLITSIDEMKGKTFGTMSGANTAPQLAARLTEAGFTSGKVISQTEDHSDNQFDTFRLLQIGSYQDLSKALEQGVVDAACMDGAIAKTYMNDRRSILDFTIDTQGYGVATVKDSALSQPVAQAVQSMIDDGTVAELTEKWN